MVQAEQAVTSGSSKVICGSVGLSASQAPGERQTAVFRRAGRAPGRLRFLTFWYLRAQGHAERTRLQPRAVRPRCKAPTSAHFAPDFPATHGPMFPRVSGVATHLGIAHQAPAPQARIVRAPGRLHASRVHLGAGLAALDLLAAGDLAHGDPSSSESVRSLPERGQLRSKAGNG